MSSANICTFDTLSGPLASFFHCLITPSMSKFISVISGNRFLQDGRLCMSSSVKTDWNCSLNKLVFAKSDVAGKPELAQRVGMPVSSPCNALINVQKDLELSFRFAAIISDM